MDEAVHKEENSKQTPIEQDWQLNKKKVIERNQFAYENGLLSDCSFLVGKDPNPQLFNSHKVILAWASPVFQAMFYGGVAEKEGPVVVPDVTPDAFKAILEYVYTDNINLKSFDLGCDLLYAAKKYILPHVVDVCKTYLANNLTYENVCRVYEFAKLLTEPEIVERCLKIMQDKTDKVIKESSFEEIDQSTLVKLLEQNSLMVASELDLIEASLRWARREAEHRDISDTDGSVLREMLGPAFALLRFLTLLPSQFASGPALSDFLTQEESFAILINLNAPGSMDIPPGICTNSQQRSCPQNDSFVWDAHLHSTNLCQRQPTFHNTGTTETSLTFNVNKNIRIIGIQLSSQVTLSGKLSDKTEIEKYNELVIVSLVGSSKNLLSYIHFEEDIPYDSVFDIKFEHSVELKQLESHVLKVWFHRQGYYPKCKYESSVGTSDVVFNFCEQSEEDVIRSIAYTPSSSSDLKTFKFTSPSSQDSSSKPRKFTFARKTTSAITSPFK